MALFTEETQSESYSKQKCGWVVGIEREGMGRGGKRREGER